MKNFCIYADQDRGKSHFVKNEILNTFKSYKQSEKTLARKNYVFDINAEYLQYNNQLRTLDKETFLNGVPCGNDCNNNVVFEEATAFFSRAGVTEGKIKEHIFRRYHSKNINVFIFHSLMFIPDDIMFAIDFHVIFRTSDDPKKIEKRFGNYPNILQAFHNVRNQTENTFFDREKKIYFDQHSQDNFHYKEIVGK